MDYARLSGLEFAALRHLTGLSFRELEAVFDVREKTIRAWESGKKPVPVDVGEKMRVLMDAHDELVSEYVGSDVEVRAKRNLSEYVRGDMPRGWYVAALARAIADDPEIVADWQ